VVAQAGQPRPTNQQRRRDS